jgi:hypothetical protein
MTLFIMLSICAVAVAMLCVQSQHAAACTARSDVYMIIYEAQIRLPCGSGSVSTQQRYSSKCNVHQDADWSMLHIVLASDVCIV